MGGLVERKEWRGLRAVREGRVCVTDGNQFFNRPGPRVVETLEILAEILGVAEPKHLGSAWRAI